MEFDKNVLLKNISYLVKKKGIKIGNLESKIGVSTGYISRISKKSNGVATGVDIIMKIAKELGVAMEVLISVDLEAIGDNEQYLLNLMKTLESKTDARAIFWETMEPRIVKEILDGETYSDIPMFEVAPGQNQYDYERPPYCEAKKIYVSYFLGLGLIQEREPYHASPWFYCNIDENNTIYVTYMIYFREDGEAQEVLEMYLKTSEYYEDFAEDGSGSSGYLQKSTPLCCSYTMGEIIDDAITSLYRTISKHQNDIRITDNVKEVLDKFMQS